MILPAKQLKRMQNRIELKWSGCGERTGGRLIRCAFFIAPTRNEFAGSESDPLPKRSAAASVCRSLHSSKTAVNDARQWTMMARLLSAVSRPPVASADLLG